MICASEDVGNADPNAIVVASACAQAVERVGMPEAQIILAHAASYVACAPKSNSVVNAIFSAMDAVKHEDTGQVPVYLRDAHYGVQQSLDTQDTNTRMIIRIITLTSSIFLIRLQAGYSMSRRTMVMREISRRILIR